jgi:TolB-like protein/tetratricopeptide (TPR) repeat protein
MSDAAKAVFLSYASQDAEAAKRIADALRAAGVEVWFDQSELVGGDAWDAKIRKQIKECALLIPVISRNTQARTEGYFRLEWRLADQRTHLMAKGRPFLLPVVIDHTHDTDAHVPDSFVEVQWTRLPAGEPGAAFAARVKRLLDATQPDEARHHAADTGATAPVQVRKGPARVWVGVGFVALSLALAYVVINSRRVPDKLERPADDVANATKASAGASLTEAQKLVAKAREMLDGGDEMNRENYRLAEELLEKAESLDLTEASAWALHAQLSSNLLLYGLDYSDTRRAAVQSQASRAAKLAPNSLESELAVALAEIHVSAKRDLPAMEKRRLDLANKYPGDWRAWRELARCYAYEQKIDLCVETEKRALELSPDDPRLKADLVNFLYNPNHYVEAERALDQALAGRQSARLWSFDALFKLIWRGDPASAVGAVQGWPLWFLGEDRGVTLASFAYLWNHEPEKALGILGRFPRDYIRNAFFYGPRAVMAAWAHEEAGEVQSARANWSIVLELSERELRAAPDDVPALHWKAWALARLGDTTAAAPILQLLEERKATIASGFDPLVGNLAALAVTVGQPDRAIADIARLQKEAASGGREITKATLNLNPLFEPLRGDPRFQALVEAAPGRRSEQPIAAKIDDKSVAVLAFANLSDDKANEYFSDGISEELLNVLAKVPGLKVTARTSSFHFKGTNTAIPEIARQLGVAYVIEGSVRKQGDKVRITAQLIKAEDGFHVWSDTFTRDLKDIFAVQDEIAGLVAKNLAAKLGATTRAAAMVDGRAFELYMQGRAAWNRRNAEGFNQAESLFRQALEIAPNFARAHAALGDVWMIRAISEGKLSEYGQRNSPVIPPIEAEVQRALELDPESAEAYTTLGFLRQLQHRPEEAVRLLRRAVELNPNYATGHHWLAGALAYECRFDESIAEYQRAVAIDPLSPRILDNYGWGLASLGRLREGLALFERALALQPGEPQAVAHRVLTLAKLGRPEEARALADTAVPELRVAILWATADQRELEAALPTGRRADRFLFLCVLGRLDEALNNFDADDVVLEDAPYWFFFPELVPFHQDPRFRRVIAELGIEENLSRALAWQAAHPPEKRDKP